MVNFNSVKQQVSSMVGMKFGSFNASVQNMDNTYKKGKKTCKTDPKLGFTQEYLNNGKKVADAFYNYTDTQTGYVIFDKNTNRAYCTGWQDKNNASDKFTRIDFCWADDGYYSVVDSNGNGVVDNDDMVTFSGKTNNGEKTSIKLTDLLG